MLQAAALHADGVKLFGIGIGPQVINFYIFTNLTTATGLIALFFGCGKVSLKNFT